MMLSVERCLMQSPLGRKKKLPMRPEEAQRVIGAPSAQVAAGTEEAQ
jgi:hypothetical protein